ncbi:MAG TPA: hypothetical protein VF781_05905 [Solirubrobacteraceae bacterium]
MSFRPGHLATHPLPAGIVGALGLGGYQLLVDVAGVGAGRLGPQAFLLVAPEPDPAMPDPGTQITLHHNRLRDDAELVSFTQLAAQLGYMRLSGYRLALERQGLRTRVNVVNPATGGIVATIPDKHSGGGRLSFGGGTNAGKLLAQVRALPPAGSPPDLQSPQLMREAVLALAIRDESITGAEAAELADRALELARGNPALDPPGALEAARGKAPGKT